MSLAAPEGDDILSIEGKDRLLLGKESLLLEVFELLAMERHWTDKQEEELKKTEGKKLVCGTEIVASSFTVRRPLSTY